MKRAGERGFTLIELVATIAFFLALLGLSLFLLRSDDYSLITRDSERRTEVASIVQAINRYTADKGELPPGIPTELKAISSGDGHYDLCKYLVPTYLKDIPLDPVLGVKGKNNNSEPTREACNTDNVGYASGYAIKQNANGTVEISAPVAEGGQHISITVPKPSY
jgi:type II secretory pathway pseudopilin PulG